MSSPRVHITQPGGRCDTKLAVMTVPRSETQGYWQSQGFVIYLLLVSTIGPEKNFLAQNI